MSKNRHVLDTLRCVERDAFVILLSDRLRDLKDARAIAAAACEQLGEHLGANRTVYGEINEKGNLVFHQVHLRGVTDLGDEGRALEPCVGRALGTLREGRVVVVDDVGAGPPLDPSSAARPDRSAAAYIAVPIVKDGRLAACLVVNHASPRAWTAEEVALVEETATRTWAAVARARAEHQLREANRRKDEFLAVLAHELRNPLAPLRNALEVMKLAPNDAKTVEQAREVMTRQLTQIVRLVDDLLDVTRISRGKVVLRRERVSLERIVKQSVETSRPLIEAASHRFTIAMPMETLFVEADPARLAQVFSNLLNNAAKYTERGGHIELSVEVDGAQAVVHVRDSGIGIPPQMLPRVFDMYLQVDRSLERAQGGLGVGLSLAKGLIELHGGSVEAHSEGLGRGCEFVVRLPIAQVIAAKPPLRRTRKAPTPAVERRRVLIVDDNRDAALSLATVLNALNYQTEVAFDGLQAIETAADFRPAIVLLDIGMPRLNGYDACRRMRKHRWARNMVIVALTGWGRAADQKRSKAAGFDFHLVKPVDPRALSRLLTSLPSSLTA